MKKDPKDSDVENTPMNTPMNTPKVERKRRNQEIDDINNIDKNTASLKKIVKESNIEKEPDKEKIDVIENIDKDTDTSLKGTEIDPHQSRRPDWTSAQTISHEKGVKDVPSISKDEVAEDNTAEQPPAAKR